MMESIYNQTTNFSKRITLTSVYVQKMEFWNVQFNTVLMKICVFTRIIQVYSTNIEAGYFKRYLYRNVDTCRSIYILNVQCFCNIKQNTRMQRFQYGNSTIVSSWKNKFYQIMIRFHKDFVNFKINIHYHLCRVFLQTYVLHFLFYYCVCTCVFVTQCTVKLMAFPTQIVMYVMYVLIVSDRDFEIKNRETRALENSVNRRMFMWLVKVMASRLLSVKYCIVVLFT